ncbi:MAG: LVIVD repeat-containing protein, partial [bacterium]
MRIQGKKKRFNVKIFLFMISICLVLSFFNKSGDARDSVNLGLVGKWGYQGAVSCVEIIEGSNPYYRYAYCGTEDGLLIIDVADPNLPKEEINLGFGKVTTIRLYEPDYGANRYAILGVQKNSTLRYVNEVFMETFYGQNGLVILDINDPTQPVYIGGYHSLEYLRDMAIIGNYAYVAEGENGLMIIDILDPTNPSYVGGYATKGEASGIEVAGNYAYVTDDENGLVIIDISDPIEPVFMGGYDTTTSG